MVIEVCPICEEEYELGVNGVDKGCDSCLGVERDNGPANTTWYPGQTEQVFGIVGSRKTFVLTREEAFRPRAEVLALIEERTGIRFD